MVIDILRQEHRNFETLLLVLKRELGLFARGERPDYEVVHAVIAYFQVYPDACHHPLEDIVFEKLKARDSAAATRIGDLAADHRKGAERLRRVAQAVENVLADRKLLRQTVNDIIRDFIEQERRHMAMEERYFFPAAVKALQPQDWAEIAARWLIRKIRSSVTLSKRSSRSYEAISCSLSRRRKPSDRALTEASAVATAPPSRSRKSSRLS